MLDDRDYMRESSRGGNWSATIALLIANAVVFVLQYTVLPRVVHESYLALSLEGIEHGYIWQLLTFQFLHGGILHLLLNCWALFMFGREVEAVLGKARFLMLYFSSGIIGGLFQVFVAWAWPMHFGGASVGASAGVFGVTAAFAMLYPDQPLTMLLFFIIPVNLRARTLLLVSLVLTAAGIAFPQAMGGNVAHAAHLGGILTGLAFIRWGGRLMFRNPFGGSRRSGDLFKSVSSKIPIWKSETKDVSEKEFISKDVDPILDKISKQGIQSLTEQERRILEAARNKMAKR